MVCTTNLDRPTHQVAPTISPPRCGLQGYKYQTYTQWRPGWVCTTMQSDKGFHDHHQNHWIQYKYNNIKIVMICWFFSRFWIRLDPSMYVTISCLILALKPTSQYSAILLASMAYTFLAPACKAKKDRIPDPAPTSKTTCNQTNNSSH